MGFRAHGFLGIDIGAHGASSICGLGRAGSRAKTLGRTGSRALGLMGFRAHELLGIGIGAHGLSGKSETSAAPHPKIKSSCEL